jgi:hypothetical protein
MPFGQSPPDMPEFLQVMMVGTFGNLGLERGVTALSRDILVVPAQLFLGRAGEQLFREAPGLLGKMRVDPMVDNLGKTIGRKLSPRAWEMAWVSLLASEISGI